MATLLSVISPTNQAARPHSNPRSTTQGWTDTTTCRTGREQPGAKRRADAALDELFKQVIAWGGSITGEHGIGLAKKRWWPLDVAKEVRDPHGTVKQALDPKGSFNPGKLV